MKEENLDRILAGDEEVVPSSGFAAAVMERVRDEAAAPQPIPFPWKRIAPAIVLIAGALVWCGVELARLKVPAARIQLPPAVLPSIKDAGWVATALAVSLLSWWLSRRIVGRSGLI